jgi:hypothetical protein
MSEEMTPPELAALAAALGSLSPAPAAVDRDRLMYEAGRESMRNTRRIWPALAAAGFLLATALGTLLAVRPPTEKIVHVQVERPQEGPRPAPAVAPQDHDSRDAPSTYWKLHVFVMERDVDELPPPPPVPLPPRPSADDL